MCVLTDNSTSCVPRLASTALRCRSLVWARLPGRVRQPPLELPAVQCAYSLNSTSCVPRLASTALRAGAWCGADCPAVYDSRLLSCQQSN
ncbi:unnamed protein product, partial [Trichogramma brassicae]